MKRFFALFTMVLLVQTAQGQVLDTSRQIASSQEFQINKMLSQHQANWGNSVRITTSREPMTDLWNGWQLGKFKKQYAVLVHYHPGLKTATVKLGSKLKGDPQGWSKTLSQEFGQQQFYKGVQSLLAQIKSRNPIPAPQDNYINDYAGTLDPSTRKVMGERLALLERQTKLEGTVVVLSALKNYTSGNIENYALQVFNSWGIGDPSKNDGFMLMVFMQDRKIRIQLGKGYGTSLNSATQSIIQNTIVPAFKLGKYNSGIQDGMLELSTLMRSHPVQTGFAAPSGAPSQVPVSAPSSWIQRFQTGWDLFTTDPGFAWNTFGWFLLLPLLIPVLMTVFFVGFVVFLIRNATGRPSPSSGRSSHHHRHRSSSIIHDLQHQHHRHDDDEARRNAYMAGAAASTVVSSWDSSSSSSSDSSSSSSDSFSGGSSDSSSGSSGDW